jgi:hypothetical protein
MDPEMARTAQELKETLENDHKGQKHEHDAKIAELSIDSAGPKNNSSDLRPPEIKAPS